MCNRMYTEASLFLHVLVTKHTPKSKMAADDNKTKRFKQVNSKFTSGEHIKK